MSRSQLTILTNICLIEDLETQRVVMQYRAPENNRWSGYAFPGGGREGDESPFECARREVYEELGIHLDEDCLLWSKIYPSVIFKGKKSVFMVGQLRQEQFDNIIFGDEGQGYQLMNVEEFLSSSQVVPQLQERLKDYLKVSD